MIVIADTTPLNYLVLIRQDGLLARFFGRVLIPPAVLAELQSPSAPESVRLWLARAPAWLQVEPLRFEPDQALKYLDRGELSAHQILLDEGSARREAARRNLPFIGTLGILRRAARLGWIDLATALDGLQRTTFYVDKKLIRSLLDEDAKRKRNL